MTFRWRLLITVSGAVVAAVAVVAWAVLASTRAAFERLDEQRTRALADQIQREFARRGEDVVRRVEGIAGAETTRRIAIELSRPDADRAPYVHEAGALASAHGLDFLELVAHDGAIVSSAQWAARFGYKEDWLLQEGGWQSQAAFLKREELAEETALALVAVRAVAAGDKNLYVVGGVRVGEKLLASLSVPPGMRAQVYDVAQPAPEPVLAAE